MSAADFHADVKSAATKEVASCLLQTWPTCTPAAPSDFAQLPKRSCVASLVAMQFKGDATNQEAVGKRKQHLSILRTWALTAPPHRRWSRADVPKLTLRTREVSEDKCWGWRL